jgi:YVTN family beta-propeller protein
MIALWPRSDPSAQTPVAAARMMAPIRTAALSCLLAVTIAGASACASGPAVILPLTFLGNIQLPKDRTTPSIDLLTLDPRNGRLYVPHGSNNALDIVDAGSSTYIGSVQGVSGVKGIALTSDPNIVFTSNGGDGSVSVVDIQALKVLSTIKVGGAPDAIAYDPVHSTVLDSLGSGNSVAFIDEKTRTLTGTLSLPGSPELMAVDPTQGRVFLSINDMAEVVVIDPGSRSIVTTFKGCNINSPTGLVYDADRQRLFVVNSIVHSANVVSMIDVLLDRCLGTVDVDHSPDQAAFNPKLHHVYVANGGSNDLSVIDSDSLKPLGVIGTGRQAGTVAADPTNDRVFVAAPIAGLIAVYHDP